MRCGQPRLRSTASHCPSTSRAALSRYSGSLAQNCTSSGRSPSQVVQCSRLRGGGGGGGRRSGMCRGYSRHARGDSADRRPAWALAQWPRLQRLQRLQRCRSGGGGGDRLRGGLGGRRQRPVWAAAAAAAAGAPVGDVVGEDARVEHGRVGAGGAVVAAQHAEGQLGLRAGRGAGWGAARSWGAAPGAGPLPLPRARRRCCAAAEGA
jgi:hypothetical protein